MTQWLENGKTCHTSNLTEVKDGLDSSLHTSPEAHNRKLNIKFQFLNWQHSDLKCTDKSEHGEVVIEEYVENKVKHFSTQLEQKFIIQQNLASHAQATCCRITSQDYEIIN